MPAADKEVLANEIEESESGSSDSDHDIPEQCFKISEKSKFFNGKRRLRKFMKRNLAKVDEFTAIECFGNSYDLEACELIAKTISERSSEQLHSANFNNMFV